MKTALVIATALFVLVVAVAMLLPGDYRVERSGVVPASPTEVEARLLDLAGWSTWCGWSSSADATCVFDVYPDARAFEWRGEANGHGRLTFAADGAPLAHELAFFAGDQVVRSYGVFELVPDADGTRVTWRLEGHMAWNPVERLVGLMMDGALGPRLESSLAGLAATFATPP